MKLLLAIDQGTTGTTVSVVDAELNILAQHDVDFQQIYPKPGWVEHGLHSIWESVLLAMKGVLSKPTFDIRNIAAIGITNQRETACFWNKKTGQPLCNAIVWQDRRTASMCEVLRKKGLERKIVVQTGLLLDPYFSGTKYRWAIENIEAVSQASKQKELAFGTIDSFLLYKLTGGVVHATEPSNASRTLLFDIHKNRWSNDLCKLFKVNLSSLPEVRDSIGYFGETRSLPCLPDGIPICGILGDQQAALLGQACVKPGQAKCTYGTGSFILMNTGTKPARSKHRLLTTIAWRWKEKTIYALEGGAFTAGAAVQWLRDELKIISKSSEIEALASQVEDSEGVVFVPAFTGIGAPHWDPNARAAALGMTRGTSKAHLARAVLEGVAHMNVEILEAMKKDSGLSLRTLNVDGGASQNNLLMQVQADLLNATLVRPKIVETTSLGAIFAAGLGAAVWNDLSAIEKAWKQDRIFQNQMKVKERQARANRWKLAIKAVKDFGNSSL